ncbi:MAG: redoxin domain-containing protein [Chloroflexi bacterium]|nr:redoxin domain-containing protein [Chloroflexota bacterium]
MDINRLSPDFELRGLDGRLCRLSDTRGRIVIVDFWSADCPHVVRADASLRAAMKRWGGDVTLLMIASNANESPSALENASHTRGPFTVLVDAKHEVADMFAAQVTPEAFVLDRAGVVRYRGAVDDVTFRQKTATRRFVEDAVDALLRGEAPEVTEVPAFGCSIVRET